MSWPDVYCPACGAQPSEPCRTFGADARRASRPHANREQAAGARQRALAAQGVTAIDAVRARHQERAARRRAIR